MNDLIFYSGLSFIMLHEMDAIRCKEWRIFPGLSLINEKLGFILFMFLHIPLFIWIFWGLSQSADPESFKTRFDIFLMIHMGLHLLFLMHKNNEFKDWISWTIISGAAICGFVDLLIR